MKIIVLGSTSPVKLEATKQAFGAYYNHFEVKPLSLPSGVNPFPTTDEETLQGALNRAEKAPVVAVVLGSDAKRSPAASVSIALYRPSIRPIA